MNLIVLSLNIKVIVRQRRVKGGLESVGWQKNTPKEDQKQMQAVYVQQAYAAKLLRYNVLKALKI